jgi:hypothetical protein
MRQNPILSPLDQGQEPYPMVLANNVGEFKMEFLDIQSGEWVPEWGFTNQMPAMIRFSLGFISPASGKVDENRIIKRIVQIPAGTVRAVWQRPVSPAGASGISRQLQ